MQKEIFISERPSVTAQAAEQPITKAPTDETKGGALKDVMISQRPEIYAPAYSPSVDSRPGIQDSGRNGDITPPPFFPLAANKEFVVMPQGPRNQDAFKKLRENQKEHKAGTIFTQHKKFIRELTQRKQQEVVDAEKKKQNDVEKAEKIKFRSTKERTSIRARSAQPKPAKPWWAMTTADAGKKLMGREETDLLDFAAGLDLEEYLDNEAVLGALETIKDVIMPKEPEPEPEPVPEQEAVVEQEEAVLDDTENDPQPEPALGATQRSMQDTRAPSAVPARPRSRPAPVPEPVIEQTISHTRRRAPTVFDEAAPVDLVRRLTRVHSAASIRRVMQTGSGAIVDETMKTGKVGVQGDTVVVRHDPADDLQYSTMDVTNTAQMRLIQRRQRAAFEDPGTLPYLYRNPAI
ncbi:hypothetical protein J8273_8338 [Carpediemonas membranifera]|uniref:Uncharacterized protein n=1 Tax=Carpediemonas membranifera TaxID=201153 RepID=A0A8J6APZ6_9EUKA|nr:hypothetical protein J8273_8338 [Carpediemonas membranifera]|eukprot:KAG9390298.1 hypothetical protein J8273_8338 [Carpediemonas membranifera]